MTPNDTTTQQRQWFTSIVDRNASTHRVDGLIGFFTDEVHLSHLSSLWHDTVRPAIGAILRFIKLWRYFFIVREHRFITSLQGKWNEAQAWIDKTNKMAPTDSRVLLTTGIYYYWTREYKKSIDYLSLVTPQNDNSKFFISLNYPADNNPIKTIGILQTQNSMNNSGGGKALMAYALIRNVEFNKARKILKGIEELNKVVEYRSAVCYVALVEYDKAFALLNKYFERQGNWMTWFKYDKVWNPIRNDLRIKSY